MRSAAIKLGLFMAVTVLILALLVVVFGEVRFRSNDGYKAVFTDSSGLKTGDFVRIAGVEVGKVESVEVYNNTLSRVTFDVDAANPLTTQTRAQVRYANLIGDRYLELADPGDGGGRLNTGGTIPVERTSPALDLDALLGGFQPLFKTLDPDTVNSISEQIVHLVQGEGGNIDQILSQTADFTDAIADRDALIGAVVTNVNTVLKSFDNNRQSLSNGLDQLQRLVSGLAGDAEPLAQAVANISDASGAVAALMQQVRPDIREDLNQISRVSSLINDDREYLDGLLTRLPADYRQLSRLGLYGDFFGFYLCDVTLKVNGPDGEPVYLELAKQGTGRCTP
ncbi:MCE family protein [Williamsia sp. DF01-3]|uniref:MCE family protein n=1 Tax=Williamsia sp. DF01-3 TaxID=2934157 RepID=UPI001FF5352D|nr:MCE family protein [Williamsia sp. DF01-3]MCK0516768.1 MCE family protein [Williamsia sp. DF01-3]